MPHDKDEALWKTSRWVVPSIFRGVKIVTAEANLKQTNMLCPVIRSCAATATSRKVYDAFSLSPRS